ARPNIGTETVRHAGMLDVFRGTITLPPLIFFVGACLGHVTMMAFLVNWWSGVPLPHKALSAVRAVHFLAIPTGVMLFALDLRPAYFPTWAPVLPEALHAALGYYGRACCLAGFVLLPLATLTRLVHRRPAALLSNHTETIDVAARLGYKPIGRCKYTYLA